ncbi:beta-ketoacyl-ACP synthase II [Spirochaetia bacterium]|nr:beta-ketoacyl-ACP synthase II [Spirochaetia bacterium]
MKRRVVVTGGGVVSALGTDWQAVSAKLRAGKNCVRYMDEWDIYEKMNTRLAAPVDFIMPGYPRKLIRGMGRIARMALVATDNAVKDAGLSGSPELGAGRCGIAYGSSMSSLDSMMDVYEMMVNKNMSKMTATTYIRAMPQTCAANLEVFFGLTGRLITCNTACTSSSMAIGFAFETIKEGRQDIMFAGGAEEMSPVNAAIFDTLFATSTKNDTPELTPSAYDKNRDGIVVGEGAGTLILEEYEHAIKRGAHIYAEVVGFGTNTDGNHITQPNKETMGGAIRLALESSGINSAEIGYVNTHGTSTAAGDVVESWATYDVLGRSLPVSTLKNYIGHTLGACGVIEAWITINMMREGWFVPNINLFQLDDKVAPLDYITGGGREIDTGCVMSNNFAFGGINTSLIFKKV